MSDLLNSASLVMIPSGYAEDKVYSVVPSDGSGDLSFTRASNGTRVNSAGLVEVCPWNLLQYSEEFDNAYWSKIGVGTGSAPTVTANYGVAPNGTNTADRVVFNTGAGTSSSDRSILRLSGAVLNNNCTGSFYIKSNTGSSQNIGFHNGGQIDIYTVTTSWQRYDAFIAASVTFFGLENLGSNSTAGTCDVLVWGGQLNYGNLAPYFPTTDRLNVPRLTYQNGGGGCPSLLLEKQSTNLVTYSEQFDNAAWVLDGDGAGQSVTANYSTSPDGTQNAERLQLNRTGGTYSRLRQAYTAGFSGSATMSVYLKTNDNTTKNVILRLGAAGSTVITVTPNWQRFTNAQSIIYSLGYDFEVFIESSQVSTVSADLSIWGAQLEQSSYPTSYIPTTSSSATRVADACSKTGISSLIGQTEGTMFIDINNQLVNPPLDTRIQLSDGSTNNWIFLGVPDGGTGGLVRCYILNVATSFNMSFYSSSALAQQRYKIAFAYKSGSFALYINGVLEGSSSATGTMPSCSALAIGGSTPTSITQDSIQQFNEVVLFPTRLTNAELASLTTI